MEPTREGSLGPVIGVIVILAIIIIGGLYFWSTRPKASNTAADAAATSSDADIQSIQSQGTSDDAAAIQADLNATNVDSVDSGLQAQQ